MIDRLALLILLQHFLFQVGQRKRSPSVLMTPRLKHFGLHEPLLFQLPSLSLHLTKPLLSR